MKKRFPVFLLLLLVTTAAAIPAVSAYMFRQTQTLESIFEPARVTCEVVEEFDDSTKSSVQVKNTSNVDVYIRVRLVIQWQDSKGNVVSRDITTSADNIQTSGDWIADKDEYTYYYKMPVAVGASTSDLLSTSIELKGIKVEVVDENTGQAAYYYYYPTVEVVAEAIQAMPHSAVRSSWGVTIDDETGEITGIANS